MNNEIFRWDDDGGGKAITDPSLKCPMRWIRKTENPNYRLNYSRNYYAANKNTKKFKTKERQRSKKRYQKLRRELEANEDKKAAYNKYMRDYQRAQRRAKGIEPRKKLSDEELRRRKKERKKNWRLTNLEKVRDIDRAKWRNMSPEARERRRQQKRIRYSNSPEQRAKHLARLHKWKLLNTEKIKAYEQARKGTERRKISSQKYEDKRKEKIWKERHPQILERARLQIEKFILREQQRQSARDERVKRREQKRPLIELKKRLDAIEWRKNNPEKYREQKTRENAKNWAAYRYGVEQGFIVPKPNMKSEERRRAGSLLRQTLNRLEQEHDRNQSRD